MRQSQSRAGTGHRANPVRRNRQGPCVLTACTAVPRIDTTRKKSRTTDSCEICSAAGRTVRGMGLGLRDHERRRDAETELQLNTLYAADHRRRTAAGIALQPSRFRPDLACAESRRFDGPTPNEAAQEQHPSCTELRCIASDRSVSLFRKAFSLPRQRSSSIRDLPLPASPDRTVKTLPLS